LVQRNVNCADQKKSEFIDCVKYEKEPCTKAQWSGSTLLMGLAVWQNVKARFEFSSTYRIGHKQKVNLTRWK